MKKLMFMFAFALVAGLILLSGFAGSASASDRTGRQPQTGGLRKPDGTPASTLININNIAGWIRNDGWSARVPSSGNSGVYYPRGTSTAIFQDGIVWGGNVNDGGSQVLRVGGQTYSIGTIGGRIISKGVAANPSDPDVRIFRIRRDYKEADLKQDAAEFFEKGLNAVTSGDIATIRAQYETDWSEWPASHGAPFYDADSNGRYEPKFNTDGSPKFRPPVGERFDAAKHADEPGIADADQVVWFVCNDLNAGRTTALYGSNPIGLELQVTLWGYNRTDPLANVYFKKFTFIYKGTTTTPTNATITDMYVGQWSDPDMGDAGDDYAGSDTTLSLVYVYNGGPTDVEYAKFGLKPPAVGYDFLQGPLVRGIAGQDINKNGIDDATDTGIFGLKRTPAGKINLPMTAAFYFASGSAISDPPFNREGTIQWYNLLRGLIPITGGPFVHPSVPGVTTYWLDGDPVKGTGRLDGVLQAPSDRRIGACAGPFTMALGDTQEVVVGVVAGIGGDYKSSISVMKNNDIAVQNAYNDLFDLPKAPPSPNVKAVALNKQIVLDWGSDRNAVEQSEAFDRKGYKFEGYNVYQLPTASSSFDQAIRLATYDLLQPQDEHTFGQAVRTIVDTVFDVSLGTGVIKVLQRGTDSGIKREFVVNEDKARTLPLVNGQYYYFAVTSYGFNPSSQALTHALESSMRVITVVPKTPDPGYRVSSQYGEVVPSNNTNPNLVKSDGTADVSMVDPTLATGKSYTITFKSIPTKFYYGPDNNGDRDTVTFDQLNWYLVRGGTDTLYRGINQGPTVPIDPGTHNLDPEVHPIFGNNFDYPIIDGMFLKVAGPPPQLSEDRSKFTAGTSWLRGAGRFVSSTSALRSQATTAYDIPILYLGAVGPGVPPSGYLDIEFRFGPGVTQKGYAYTRSVTSQETGSRYKYTGYFDVPFQVWDVSNPAQPRQVNCGWRDQIRNDRWDVGAGAANLEIIFVATTTYDGNTPTTYGTVVGTSNNNIQGFGIATSVPIASQYMMCAEWINATGNNADIPASTILVSPNRVLTASDAFAFTAPAASVYDAKNAKADVTQINVFPNPYYGFNRAETTRPSRFVTFNHLPPRAEIRIFNLAGALVRAYDETAAPPLQRTGQYQNWDLRNQNGLPVASGVYIAYITMPDLGATKTLKLIVVQEQQFLENF
jgi:hypothetical protein